MSRITNFFRSFDLFGIRPSVYFRGRLKSGTGFGFCLTILLLTFTAICFGYFGQDLYYRLDPSLRYHESYYATPEKITLDPELSPIIIELNSPFGDKYYTSSNLLTVNVSQLTIAKSGNDTTVIFDDYPMEICNPSYFTKLDPDTQSYFLNKHLSDYYCIPRYLKNLTMVGAFDQDLFQTIKFTVKMCNNYTSNGTCLPIDQIKTTLAGGFIGIYFADYMIDPSDYAMPKKTQPKEVFTNFVLNSQKEIDVFLRNNYISTEDGVIFTKKNIDRVPSFLESVDFDFQTQNEDFLMVYFKIKQQNAYYERSYTKLQDLLAQIGGFINCFWILASIVNYFYSNLFLISEIIVNIFTIKVPMTTTYKKVKANDPKSDRKEIDKNLVSLREDSENIIAITSTQKREESEEKPSPEYKKIQMSPQILKKDFIDNIDESKGKPEVSLEDIEKEVNSAFSTRKIAEVQKLQKIDEEMKNFELIESLNLSFLDYFHYYTGLFNSPERERKKMIINKGSSIVRNCLDIKYIIQKFYEIEKLKQILLSEADIDKFSHLPKPELQILIDKPTGKKAKESIMTNILSKRVSLDCETELVNTAKSMKKSKFSNNV